MSFPEVQSSVKYYISFLQQIPFNHSTRIGLYELIKTSEWVMNIYIWLYYLILVNLNAKEKYNNIIWCFFCLQIDISRKVRCHPFLYCVLKIKLSFCTQNLSSIVVFQWYSFSSHSLSPGLEDLLLRMLIKDPSNRITIADMKVLM